MTPNVTLIPGDGVGPELVDIAVDCLEATGVKFHWDRIELGGGDAPSKLGAMLDSIRRNKVALKGPVTTPVGGGFRSINVALRKTLDLYACVRPCRHYPGVPAPRPGVDLVVVRENTEDLYVGVEFEKGRPETKELIRFIKEKSGADLGDAGISIKAATTEASERIVRYAFEYAKAHGRKKVTAVTKSNIMKHTDGLFQRAAAEVAKDYNIGFEHRLVDAVCMQLVTDPRQFDVIVTTNLYGDILSDLTAGLVGGLGVAPGYNVGGEYAVFEATHGSSPDFKGKDMLNPAALILSGAHMLGHLGEKDAALAVESAVAAVLAEGRHVTFDIKRENPASSTRMGAAVAEKIRGLMRWR